MTFVNAVYYQNKFEGVKQIFYRTILELLGTYLFEAKHTFYFIGLNMLLRSLKGYNILLNTSYTHNLFYLQAV